MTIQPTSLVSYYEILPNLGKRQKMVLEVIENNPEITNTEIAAQLKFPINSITPRVFELRKKGLVCISRIRKCKVTGKNVIAWQTNTNAGRLKPEEEDKILKQNTQSRLI
jgi:transcription initiation factor IIE alpha subunit